MSPEIIYFSKYIEKELGIVYSEFNYYQLQNRLEEITRILSLKDVAELHRAAQKNMTSDMKQLILDIATNNETSFFRDPKLFKTINSEILPKLLAAAPGKSRVRIWSAASSYGQEPYTLSMMVSEHRRAVSTANTSVEILATDISSRALERAKSGRYSQLEVQRGLASPLLIKYFQKDAGNFWTISAELRAMIQFQTINLLSPFDRLGKFDMILCRNVLIYQNVENKTKIITKLASCLNPGGILILGSGESMIGLSDSFDTVKSEDALYYRLASKVAKAA